MLMASFFDFFRAQQPPLIQQALADMRVMLETAHEMFVAAAAHLLDNEALPFDMDAKDDIVDAREQAIRRMILEHVAIDPSHEMVFSLVLVSIVQDAERIGDLATSLAELDALAAGPRMGPHVATLRTIRDDVTAMFDTTRNGFIQSDAALAQQAMDKSRDVKARAQALLETLATGEGTSANEALVLGLATRMIGRTASHLSNIASSVTLPFHQIRRNDESI